MALNRIRACIHIHTYIYICMYVYIYICICIFIFHLYIIAIHTENHIEHNYFPCPNVFWQLLTVAGYFVVILMAAEITVPLDVT